MSVVAKTEVRVERARGLAKVRSTRGRSLAFLAWLIFWAGYMALYGLVRERGSIMAMGMSLVVLLAIVSHESIARVFLSWAPFALFLYLYDLTRGAAGNGRGVHVTEPVAVDRMLGFGNVPTVWLQHHLLDVARVQWWEALVALVYVSHFIVPFAVVFVLWFRNREAWRQWVVAFFTTSTLGLVGYVAYPMAPPWLAGLPSRHYYLPALRGVHRVTTRGLDLLNLHFAGDAIGVGSRSHNEVAAMPSLHTAFSVVAVGFFIERGTSRWRWLLVLYPIAMGFTLVYTAEHYVIDVIAGTACALIGLWVARRVAERRERRMVSPDRELVSSS